MKPTWSIRRRILAWLFLAMTMVFSANLLSSYYTNSAAANRAYDRLLLASATAIAERTAIKKGLLHVDIPYAALDMLASTAQDRVFYAVSGPNGEMITGYEGIPEPTGHPQRTQDQKPQLQSFYNATYKNVPVRVVVLRSFISSQHLSGYATVTVAQTRGDRDGLTFSLLRDSAVWMLIIAIVGAIAAWIGVSFGLRPLGRLREALGRRSPDDVRPVLHNVPSEFQPLVSAINSMLHRLDGGLLSMRNFISDASHQLKTPLASLQVQGEMALRETDPQAVRAALTKVNISVQRTSRLAQQLLSHARATDDRAAFAVFDFANVARETIEIALPQAIQKSIDLGYEGPEHVKINGDRALLGELVLNLTDNALKYAPSQSIVTIALEDRGKQVRLVVEDNGPGIPAAEYDHVFERFVRLDKASAEGCGLGLAIVREVANHHDATVVMKDGAHGGLRVEVDFPEQKKGEG